MTSVRRVAGVGVGVGCVEQIMSFRLLCDDAVCKKTNLYVLLIDFLKLTIKYDAISF